MTLLSHSRSIIIYSAANTHLQDGSLRTENICIGKWIRRKRNEIRLVGHMERRNNDRMVKVSQLKEQREALAGLDLEENLLRN